MEVQNNLNQPEHLEIKFADGDLIGKTVILYPYWYKSLYAFKVDGGFGALPNAMGNGVFGYFTVDGERARTERWKIWCYCPDEWLEDGRHLRSILAPGRLGVLCHWYILCRRRAVGRALSYAGLRP